LYEGPGLTGFDWREGSTDPTYLTIAPLEGVGLADVTRANAETATFLTEVEPEVGEVYYVRSHVYGHDAELALEVVAVDSEEQSLTFDWRRLYVHNDD